MPTDVRFDADPEATQPTPSVDSDGTAPRISFSDPNRTVVRSEGQPQEGCPPGFEIHDVLGRGGMGVVYLARQIALDRLVALKMVKVSPTSGPLDDKLLGQHIRFFAEAQAVAKLDHGNVVKLHEFGEHDGNPYMVLEYCPGGDLRPLVGSISTRDKTWFDRVVGVMVGVADGVRAAHDQGIVHRDLKPGNVLLTKDGTPKVADFGLVKGLGTHDLTDTVSSMGTPAYMAPEQAAGRTKFVGPEADVWALGVMLYELLSGGLPIDMSGTKGEILARVAAGSVAQLRDKCKGVPRDLGLITHKCLTLDPRERYHTAGELAADLRNHLAGKPITVRPAGSVERAWKWVKRNPVPSVSAAVVFVALSVGVGVATWQAAVATDARDEADRKARLEREARIEAELRRQEANDRARLATETTRFLQSVLAQARAVSDFDPKWQPTTDLTVREALDRAALRIKGRFPDEPQVEAKLQNTIGVTYAELGYPEKAESHLRRAFELYDRHFGPDDPDTLYTAKNVAALQLLRGEFAAAELTLQRVRTAQARVLGPEHRETLESDAALAELAAAQGRYQDAEHLAQVTFDIRKKVLGGGDPDTLFSAGRLAVLYRETGRLDEAEKHTFWALNGCKQIHGVDHPVTAQVRTGLARIYLLRGQHEDAAEIFTRSLATFEKSVGLSHPHTQRCAEWLAECHAARGKPEPAIPLLRQVLVVREAREPSGWELSGTQSRLGEVLSAAGKHAEAEPLLMVGFKGLEERQAKIPAYFRSPELAAAAKRLARHYNAVKQPKKASEWQAVAERYSNAP